LTKPLLLQKKNSIFNIVFQQKAGSGLDG